MHKTFFSPLLLSLVFIVGCQSESPSTGDAADSGTSGGLTEFQLEHGIGPITEPVRLAGEPDEALVAKGRSIFEMKCETCHRMDGRFVGPALGDITDQRSPAFIMNMILNPQEMLEKHPQAQALLAEYLTPMPFQNVTEEEARAIVEFLRYAND